MGILFQIGGIVSLSPAGFLEGRDTPFTMNQVLLGPGLCYNMHTGYKGPLGGKKETFLGLWNPGTNRRPTPFSRA